MPNLFEKRSDLKLIYHLVITVVFIYLFYQLLSMRRSNMIYLYWSEYVMNRYCFILYILLSIFIFTKDSYTGILLLVLAVGSYKTAFKEYFIDTSEIKDPKYLTSDTVPTKIVDYKIMSDLPVPTVTSLQDNVNTSSLLKSQALGEDERFKTDDVAIKEILRQIKSQVDFDPYKTQLDKDVIHEIYNKYFDNDIFIKLKNNNDDSASYLAAGNFNYIPTVAQVDYDLVTYQNLSNNTGFGINPLTDGIANKTKINR
jgi:hypothetical protein